jgi:hypothetical protein
MHRASAPPSAAATVDLTLLDELLDTFMTDSWVDGERSSGVLPER